MNNEGLHPQNWRLEVKNGVKGPELGRDGMATSIDELRSQLSIANQALDRAKADRADMDDQPNLSENSSIKVEDLPVADEDDKAYMDREVAKAQEKVDKIQAKLEIAERIKKVESAIESLKSRISELKQNRQQLDILKKSSVDLVGDDKDGISSGFDDMMTRIDQQINLLDSQKANLGVFLILGEANLRGEFSDEDVTAVREILKDAASLLTDEIRGKALRIAEKTKRSQIKDAQELADYRILAGTLSGIELARLKREIVLLEKSLASAGVDANNEEQMAELLGLADLAVNDRAAAKVDEDDSAPVESISDEEDQAAEDFMDKFLACEDLLVELDKAVSENNRDEISRIVGTLEANAIDIPTHLNEVKSGELKDRFQGLWAEMKLTEKIAEAKKLLVEDEQPEGADGDIVVDEEEAGADAAGETIDESAEVSDEEAENEPVLNRKIQIFRRIASMFTGALSWLNRNAGGRDEDEVTATVPENSAPAANEKDKEESAKIYDIQSKSLNGIDREIKMILFRKERGKSDPEDAKKFAFALDSLYLTDVEVVNDDETRLTESDQKKLNGQIDRISQVLERGVGVNWDVIVTKMETDVKEKATLADEAEDRVAWFTKLFSGETPEGGAPENLDDDQSADGAKADGTPEADQADLSAKIENLNL